MWTNAGVGSGFSLSPLFGPGARSRLPLRNRLRVGELEVDAGLPEVAQERVLDAAVSQDGLERADRLDSEPCLREVACLRRDAPEADGRARGERLHDDVGDADTVERREELLLARTPLGLLGTCLLSHRSSPSPAPAPRRSPPARRPPRPARSGARPRSDRAPRGTAPRRSPPQPAAPTRRAPPAAAAPVSAPRGRSR